MRKPRFLIGLVEVARIADDLRSGLEALGYTADLVLWEQNKFYPQTSCRTVLFEAAGITTGKISGGEWLRLQIALWRRLPSWLSAYDVFVLIAEKTLLPWNLDILLLKALGKKIVRIWCGSEIRYWHAYEQEMKSLGMQQDVALFLGSIRGKLNDRYLEKLWQVRIGERFSNLVYAQASYAQLLQRPYQRMALPVVLSDCSYHVPDRQHPLVVHAPSNPGRKGTLVIQEIVDQLHAEGLLFEYQTLQNRSNSEIRAALAEADILVDQLISAIIGKLALEGMASGCVVLGRYAPDYAPAPPGCPMVIVTEQTLKDRLREVITDRDLRLHLAQAGRSYVETYYDHREFARQMVEALAQGPQARYTTTPTFYKGYRPSLRQILRETADQVRWLFDKALTPIKKIRRP